MDIKLEINTAEISGRKWDALIAFVQAMKAPVPVEDVITLPRNLEALNSQEIKRALAYAVEPTQPFVVTETTPTSITLAPADNPAAGIDADAALQSAGFGSGTVAPPVPVPDAGAVPPVPPATPPAPFVPGSAPAATPPVSTGNVQLDSKGLPWDHRIHSSERTQNKDGSWRNKRGLPDGLVAQVEAELRAVLGVAAPPPPHPLAGGSAPGFPGVSSMPPVTGTPAVPMTFMTLLTKVTKAIKDGQLAQDRVNATLVEFSLPNLPAIHHRPDLVQAFHDRLFGAA